MKTVTIDLESCYGIKKLQTKFDFSKAKACAVYAPNGSMKSSLVGADLNLTHRADPILTRGWMPTF